VDTKYEFGKTKDGVIVLIDEIHTPDSSPIFIQKDIKKKTR
jgi:phosphoribosylaminoimidazole-succinocarboxamide synthase